MSPLGFNYYSIVPFVSGILTLTLGLFTYVRNPSSKIHRRFSLMCLTMMVWPISLGMFLNSNDPRTIVFWTVIGHSTCTITPAVYFDFVITLLGKERLRRVSWLYYVVAGTLLLTSWIKSEWFFPGHVNRYAWGAYAVPSPLIAVDASIAVVVLIVSCWLIYRAWRTGKDRLPPEEINRFKHLSVALVVFAFVVIDYLPKYGISILPVGSIFIAIFVTLVSYAIVRHRLFDITLAIRRTVVYSVLVAVITAVYFSLVLAAEKVFQGMIGYRSLIASVVAGFVIALGFTPLKEAIQRFIDRLFFRGTQAALAEENERLRQELARAEKLKVISTLAAGMAHEIKNPLSSIKIFAECLPEKYEEPDFRQKFARIVSHEVGRINILVQRLLDFAKPSPPQKQPVRLATVLDETLEFLHDTLVKHRITIARAYAQRDLVCVDAAQIKQVLLNLLLNSIEAINGRGGCISLSTVAVNGHLELLITDTGPGIPKQELARVFDPFYTTKPHGTGLGLSVVHSIIREHGGRIALDSDLGRGVTVRISLPFADSRPQT